MTDDYRYVHTNVVSCDGNGDDGGFGHPKVYLNLKKNGRIDCTYCGRVFIYKENNHEKVEMGEEEH